MAVVNLSAAPSKLPIIKVNDRQLRDITREALGALGQYNQPPQLYVRSGRPVRVVRDEVGRQIIADLTEHALRGHLARAADYQRIGVKGRSACSPPMDMVRDVLTLAPAEWKFPSLRAVTEVPVLRPDGTVLDTLGYDPATCFVYVPSPDLKIPPVPAFPTATDIQKARETLLDVIGQFSFVDTASRTNMLAAILTPICRPRINGHVPIGIFDATDPGSGKSLLTELISIIATGRDSPMFSAPTEEAEWRKQLTSALRIGTATIVVDNVTRRLDSGELCKVLTASTHSDCLLGTNEIITLPVLAACFATGNAVQVGGDMPRRCYWIRLDPKCS